MTPGRLPARSTEPGRKRARPASARSAERQRALLDAARLITASTHDLDAVLDALAEQARRLLGAAAAAIDLVHAPKQLVARRGTRLVRPGSPLGVPGFRYRPGGMTREAFATGRPVFARDYHADPRPDPAYKEERAPVASLLIVPLRSGEEPLGILSAEWAHRVDLRPEDVELADALGAQAAAAIRTARLHDALRRSEERYRLVTESVPLGIWEWDLRTGTVTWSGAGRGVLGYEPGESTASAAWWHELVHPDEREVVQANAAQAIAAGADRLSNELRVRRADGSYARVAVLLLRLFRDESGDPLRAFGMIQDVTSLRTAEAEHDRLTEALARAEERERVAMDLHDGALGSLAGVAYALTGAARTLPAEAVQAGRALTSALELTKAAMAELRGYASGLRPPIDQPVPARLETLAVEARTAGVRVEVDVTENAAARAAALPPAAAGDLVLVAREAVANALRHGSPTRLELALSATADDLRLVVRDDGPGFDPDAVGERPGQGLGNMHARATRVNGRLEIVSRPGAGTEVRLIVSLPSGAPKQETRM
jgi:PAS domain S-box-containing protein